MVLMSGDREMSPSSEEFIARVGSTTSAEDSAGMSGDLDMVWSDKMKSDDTTDPAAAGSLLTREQEPGS